MVKDEFGSQEILITEFAIRIQYDLLQFLNIYKSEFLCLRWYWAPAPHDLSGTVLDLEQ